MALSHVLLRNLRSEAAKEIRALPAYDFDAMKNRQPSLLSFATADDILEFFSTAKSELEREAIFRVLVIEYQGADATPLVANLLMYILAPDMRQMTRAFKTALSRDDFLQVALTALFEVLKKFSMVQIGNGEVFDCLRKSFRTHLNEDVARERKVEFAADHVWRLVAPLGEHGLGLRPPSERVKEPFYDEEKSEGRRLFLALVGPEGARSQGVPVWIATTIEGKSFRQLALDMGPANSDREIERICGMLRRRKQRVKEKLLKLLTTPGMIPT